MSDRWSKMGEGFGEVGTVVPAQAGLGHESGREPRRGVHVSVRTSMPGDDERLRAMFSRSSAETIYRRFHTPFQEVPGWMVKLMVGSDHHDKEVLLAVAGDEIVGHAMFVRLGDSDEAEMAIIVEDRWQSNGVGKMLVSELTRRARYRGIETFTAEVLLENRRMLGLASKFAGTGYTMEGGVSHVRMPLRAPDSTTDTAQTFRRAA